MLSWFKWTDLYVSGQLWWICISSLCSGIASHLSGFNSLRWRWATGDDAIIQWAKMIDVTSGWVSWWGREGAEDRLTKAKERYSQRFKKQDLELAFMYMEKYHCSKTFIYLIGSAKLLIHGGSRLAHYLSFIIILLIFAHVLDFCWMFLFQMPQHFQSYISYYDVVP